MRKSWDDYFLSIAKEVATRSTCDRKMVGAVLVRDRVILATGYNGSVRGTPHCDEAGHLMENDHCIRTIHAEQNAIVQAAMLGVAIREAELYVTASPCWICFKLLANARIGRMVYGEFYRDDRIVQAASDLGIKLLHEGVLIRP